MYVDNNNQSYQKIIIFLETASTNIDISGTLPHTCCLKYFLLDILVSCFPNFSVACLSSHSAPVLSLFGYSKLIQSFHSHSANIRASGGDSEVHNIKINLLLENFEKVYGRFNFCKGDYVTPVSHNL